MNIVIPEPRWNSDLTHIILDLEKMRTGWRSEVPAYIFFQLKQIFQILETLGSARIEGNNTTLSEFVERIVGHEPVSDERGLELENLEKGIAFIEEKTTSETKISFEYIMNLHEILVQGLSPPAGRGEGSAAPGKLRSHNVKISKSKHVPPAANVLGYYFEEFIDFINQPLMSQNQLLMVAIAHHRFMYIHPFDNGNGRMGRLLNYAFLIKFGFKIKNGRFINPSSVFYTDRDKYYDMLGRADSLSDVDLLAWAEYFLRGLKNQIKKIDSLMDRQYTCGKILLPSIQVALDRQHINQTESNILSYIVQNDRMCVKSSELDRFGCVTSKQKTAVMKALKDKGMVRSLEDGGRIYTIQFANNYLLRSVIKTLEANGFVADFLNSND